MSHRLNRLLLLLLFTGTVVTFLTWRTAETVRERIAKEAASDSLRDSATEAQEPSGRVGPPSPGSAGEMGGSVQSRDRKRTGSYEDFLKKFQETEEALNLLDQGKSEGSVARRNQALSQLRYWETQLNAVYSAVMDALPDSEAAALAREQQAWRKTREETAALSVKNSGGSAEQGAEYTFRQAELTRERAYELLERHRFLLVE